MASITAIKLSINGTEVKAPKVGGLTYKREKVWSTNTGRTTSGKMVGTIKCIKTTLSIAWPPLTQAEKELIEGLVSDESTPFSTLEWTEPDGTTTAMECYFGTPSFTMWDQIGGMWRCTDGKVDAIER